MDNVKAKLAAIRKAAQQRAEARRALKRQEAAERARIRREGRQSSHDEIKLVREYLKTLVGAVPWIDHIYPCTVIRIDVTADGKPTGACLVDYHAANHKPLWALHGDKKPILNEEYALFYPSKGANPWIEIPSQKYIYWATAAPNSNPDDIIENYGIYRMPFPPQNYADAELMCVVPRTVGDWGIRDFLGVDGLGNVWVSYSRTDGYGLKCIPDGGQGVQSPIVPTFDRIPRAVDSTAGESHIVFSTEERATNTWVTEHHYVHSDYIAAFLHLQDDGGTTYGAGNISYAELGGVIGDQVAGYILPSYHTPHGEPLTGPAHYIPPNDGTSAAPHYHWHLVTGVPSESFGPDTSESHSDTVSRRVHMEYGTPTFTGHTFTLGYTHDSFIEINGAPLMDIYGTYNGGGWSGRAGEWQPSSAMVDWIVSGGADITRPFVPGHIITDKWSTERFNQPLFVYHPHIWTAQKGEYGGENQVVVAMPAINYPHPEEWSGPLRVNASAPDFHNVPPNNFTVAEYVPPTLGTYGRQVWSVGPNETGGLNFIGTWDNEEPLGLETDPEEPDRHTFAIAEGDTLEISATPGITQIYADGRNGLDLVGFKFSGFTIVGVYYSEDGGKTWDFTFKDTAHSGDHLPSLITHYGDGFIVEL